MLTRNIFTLFFNRPVAFVAGVLTTGVAASVGSFSVALLIPTFILLLGNTVTGIPGPLQTIATIPTAYKAACVIVLIGIKSGCAVLSSFVSGWVVRPMLLDLRKQALHKLVTADMGYISSAAAGKLLSSFAQIEQTGKFYLVCMTLFSNFLTVVSFCLVLILISWQLTLATFVLLPVLMQLNQWMVNRAKSSGAEVNRQASALTSSILETINGFKLIKLFSAEDRELKKSLQLADNCVEADLRLDFLQGCVGPYNEFIGVSALLAILLVAQVVLPGGPTTATLLLLFLVVFFRLLPFVGVLTMRRTELARLSSSVEATLAFLNEQTGGPANGKLTITTLREGIRFESVSFQYQRHKRSSDSVLDSLDMYFARGTTLALVGPSGVGKSTIADLICRFYDPTAGRITVDGIDLRELEMGSWRRKIGVVSQDAFLFHNSIRYNLAFAKPDATEEEMVEAARQAHALPFVQRMPDGFDTVVGDRGAKLSGGERQRLAIARAFLVNPEILILDEATSALDSISERIVQEAVEDLMRNRTTLIIAHRLSTIQKCNQIGVVDRGKIVEWGNHEELLSQDGYYKRLHEAQFGGDSVHLNQ